jgi:hypothetical protein
MMAVSIAQNKILPRPVFRCHNHPNEPIETVVCPGLCARKGPKIQTLLQSRQTSLKSPTTASSRQHLVTKTDTELL